MTKIVINKCYGGFSLSQEALDLYAKAKGLDTGDWNKWGYYDNISEREIARHDPVLIDIVEQLGKKANGKYADLYIVEIPDDVKYVIEEYDGQEWIAEEHRTWS